MKNKAAEETIRRAGRERKIEKDEIENRKKYINTIAEYLQMIISVYPGITKEELKNLFLQDICDEIQEYCDISNIRGRYYQIEAARVMLADKSIIDLEYGKMLRGESNYKGSDVYTANLRKSCAELIGQVYGHLKKTEKEISPSLLEIVERYNNSDDRGKKNILEKEIVKDSVGEFIKLSRSLDGTYEERIYKKIEDDIEVFQKELERLQIESMEFLGRKFEQYGFIEKYKKINDTIMKKIDMPNYTCELSTNESSVDNFGIKELFTKEFLTLLDHEDLMMLSVFWQNRYAKEWKSMGEAFFTIDTLNLWDKIMAGETNIDLSEEDISGVYNKCRCLEELTASFLSNLKGKNKEQSEEDWERGYKIIDGSDEIKKLVKQEGANYKKIFDYLLPDQENDLDNDFEIYKLLLNQSENIYLIRNSILGCKIRSLFDSKKCKNWGVIEEFVNGKKKNVEDQMYVLIGIDQEGLNMPVRLHMKKEDLLNFITSYNGETKLPLYEGAQDFWINGELVTTSMLMPMQKSQKKYLNEKYKELSGHGTDNEKMVAHLRFLKDKDKFPHHLMTRKITQSGVKLTRPPRKYIDLITGQTYIMKSGEYVEIDNQEERKDDGR